MNASTSFTFYGDLLGIGAAYSLSPKLAYTKLDTFYNTVIQSFFPAPNLGRGLIHRFGSDADGSEPSGRTSFRVIFAVFVEQFKNGLRCSMRRATAASHMAQISSTLTNSLQTLRIPKNKERYSTTLMT